MPRTKEKKKSSSKKPNKKKGSEEEEKKITDKDETEEYGIVTKILGGSRFTVQLMTGQQIIGKLMCKLRSKKHKGSNRVDIGKIVLIAFRDFQSSQEIADISYVFESVEAKKLKKEGKIKFDIQEDTDEVEFTEELEELDIREI